VFEAELKTTLKRIFDLPKVTYDAPSEAMEQETLFVDIEKATCDIVEKRARARVNGMGFIFGNADKLPYGYFAKQIAKASKFDLNKFFFFETDKSDPTQNNIVRRSFKFVFFYDSQYNPNLGMITDINFLEGEAP